MDQDTAGKGEGGMRQELPKQPTNQTRFEALVEQMNRIEEWVEGKDRRKAYYRHPDNRNHHAENQ